MIGLPENPSKRVECFFPGLSLLQRRRFAAMQEIYAEWNAKINVISRKDMDAFYTHHVLHSLAIAKVVDFKPGTHVVDVGTGGGFPGIPLAVLFPEVRFSLVDSIGKKIKVVEAAARELGLQNTVAVNGRAEDLRERFDFVVSRAVCAMPEFYGYVHRLVSKKQRNTLPNGILYLKGGDLRQELQAFAGRVTEYAIPDLFEGFSRLSPEEEREEVLRFFETKKVIHLAF